MNNIEKLSLVELLNEQSNELPSQDMYAHVKKAVRDLDGWVSLNNLKSIMTTLKAIKGKTYKGSDGLTAFYKLYKSTEGEDFLDDVNSVGVKNLGFGEGAELKDEILAIINGTSNSTQNPKTQNPKSQTLKKKVGNANITMNGGGNKISWKPCTSMPFMIGCTSQKIKEIQSCLNITADSKFGYGTKKALVSAGHNMNRGLTQDIYDGVMSNCQKRTTTPTNTSNTTKTTNSGGGTTAKQIYNRFVKNNTLKTQDNTRDGDLMIYDGPKLSNVEINQLTSALGTMNYVRLNPKDMLDNHGDIVFKKQ